MDELADVVALEVSSESGAAGAGRGSLWTIGKSGCWLLANPCDGRRRRKWAAGRCVPKLCPRYALLPLLTRLA